MGACGEGGLLLVCSHHAWWPPAFPGGDMQEEATHKGLDFRGGVRTGDADLSYCASRWWPKPWAGRTPSEAGVGKERAKRRRWPAGVLKAPSRESEGKQRRNPEGQRSGEIQRGQRRRKFQSRHCCQRVQADPVTERILDYG